MIAKIMLVSLLWVCAYSWCLKTIFAGKDEIKSIDFSPDGQYILTAESSGRILLWKSDTLEILKVYDFGTTAQEAVFSKDQSMIAVGGNSGNVRILNPTTFTVTKTFATGHGIVWDLDFRYDSDRLLTCGEDKEIRSWNVNGAGTWNMEWEEQPHHQITTCEYAKNDYSSCGGRHFGNSFTNAGGEVLDDHDGGDNYYWGLRCRTDSASCIAVNGNGTVAEWALTADTVFSRWSTSSGALYAAGYAPDNTYFAVAGSSSKIFMYNGTNRVNTLVQELQTNSTSDLVSARFSYDSNYLAVGNKNGTVFLYYRFCEGCPVGTYRNQSVCRACYLDIAACAICTNSTSCQACNAGYYVNNGGCSSCDIQEGCVECNSSTACTSCLPGFYLSGTSCARCYSQMPGCLSCVDSSTCLTCDNLYTLVGGDCETCTSNIDNCIYCNSTSYCLECSIGFYELNGICLLCDAPCKTCQASDNCTECFVGYYLNAGVCDRCLDSHCLACNSTGHCYDCEEDHYVNSTFGCQACVHPCSSCNTSSFCLSCVLGYYLSNAATGVCTNCPAACLSCNTTTYCMSCDTGYFLNVATHVCTHCHIVDPFCSLCNSTHCLTCEAGTLLQSDGTCGHCNADILNCMVCFNDSICSHCLTGFYATGLTANDSCNTCEPGCQSCENSTQCSVCQPGYYFSSKDCYLCSSQCLTCSSATDCLSCSEEMYLSSNTCLYCKDQINNCTSCLTSTNCLACALGYYLASPTTCTVCTYPCTTCQTTSTHCLTCALGFYISANVCTQCHANCTECLTAADNCTVCAIGFYLDDPTDACLQCTVSNCVVCSNSTECLECESGFFFDGSSCSLCTTSIPNCLRCSTAGDYCSLCEYSYTLASSDTTCDLCSLHLTGCQHCSSTALCETCMTGYFPNATNQCEKCTIGCYSCLDFNTCEVCIDSYVLSGGDCLLCEDQVVGCHLCTGVSTCINCIEGYYLNSNACTPCINDLVGCEACLSSSECILCSIFYELNTISNECELCSTLYPSCQICFNNSCIQCQVGTFLESDGLCYSCNATEGCLKCNSSAICIQCQSGYRMLSDSCQKCDVAFSNCLYCSEVECTQCESGLYLNGGSCEACPMEGCQLCLEANASACLVCNSRYFLSNDVCELCSDSISNCMQCYVSGVCTECDYGFYIDASFSCSLCSSLYDGCSSCTISGCLDCKANFFLDTSSTPNVCQPCTDTLPGCAFCSGPSVCLNCQNGYYINGNSCESCSEIPGCLYCTDSSTCTYCQESFYLETSPNQCSLCADIIPACYACDSNVTCISCFGNYELLGGVCEQIKGEVSYDYPQLTLQSYYEDKDTLKHVLSCTSEKFVQIQHEWSKSYGLWIIDSSYNQIQLTIKDITWSKDSYHMNFYTNNPIGDQVENSFKNMPFMISRRLQQIQGRLLPEASIDLNFDFKIMLTEDAVHDLLPQLDHLGDLYLNYPLEDPAFYNSYLKNKSYYHYIFGLVITIILLLTYTVKTCCLLPETKNKGQIIPHVFAIKCGGLALYPTYGEFISYCYGFMSADIPWLNRQIGPVFGREDDEIPGPHAMYYFTLSLSSTFFLATILIAFSWFFTALYGYCRPQSKILCNSFKSFLYNFFMMGVIIAGCLSLEGAILNPITSLNLYSFFYILGILIYVGVFVEIIYSIITRRKTETFSLIGKNKILEEEKGLPDNFHKIRVFFKATLLSVLHLSPIYFFIILFCAEISAISIDYYLRKQEKNSPRLEAAQHILINIALGMVLCVPNALLGLLVVSSLIVTVIVLDFVVIYREYSERGILHKRDGLQSKYEGGVYDFKYGMKELTENHLKEKEEPSLQIYDLFDANQKVPNDKEDEIKKDNIYRRKNKHEDKKRKTFTVNELD